MYHFMYQCIYQLFEKKSEKQKIIFLHLLTYLVIFYLFISTNMHTAIICSIFRYKLSVNNESNERFKN